MTNNKDMIFYDKVREAVALEIDDVLTTSTLNLIWLQQNLEFIAVLKDNTSYLISVKPITDEIEVRKNKHYIDIENLIKDLVKKVNE